MTGIEALALARDGNLDALSADLGALGEAVEELLASGDTTAALELFARTWRLWLARGELDNGAALAAHALAATASAKEPIWRIRALYADGLLAFRAGDRDRSLARNQEALQAAQAARDVRGQCDALTGLARIALRDGGYEEVVRLSQEARKLAQLAGDREAEAAQLHLEAAGIRLQQRYDEARELYVESLQLNVRLRNAPWVAMEQHNLGWVELHLGNLDAAEKWFRVADDARGADLYGRAWGDLNAAAIAAKRGHFADARRLFSMGSETLGSAGLTLDPDDKFEFDWLASVLESMQPER